MAARGGIAAHSAGLRAGDAPEAEVRALTAAETAWLLLVPALAATLLAVVVLGPPLGRLAFTGTHYAYWASAARDQLRPKPTELARFALTIACALGFAGAIGLAAARPLHMRASRVRRAVLLVQVAVVAALTWFWIAQSGVDPYDIGDPTYFAPLAIVVAGALAALGGWALTRRRPLPLPLDAGPGWRLACTAAAVLLTVVWLLPSILTDANIVYAQPITGIHVQFTYDEAMSVLDGRSPLVDMATYGALVPYLIALPLAALGASLAAFSTLMTSLTALALLAVFALLRRLVRSPLAALALYMPFLATSLFIVRGESIARFDYGNYFGMFPVRYGGPYVLAWLTTRQLDGDRPRSAVALFAVAGLVLLNNTDFGLPALGATVVALVCARPPRDRAALLSLAGRIAAGLAIALALVSLLTLLRAGTLPHLGRLTAYARIFGIAGFGNLPTPLLGFHLVVLATFVAALATAVVRTLGRDPDAPLTGMLAWCGVFGLGTGAYFAYRSHPDTLIASFSIWSLTLALLLIATVRTARARGPALPSPATIALLFGCGIAVCSIAQLPLPWQQVERISRSSDQRPLEWTAARRFIHAFVRPGDHVAIVTALGHRIGYELDVRNVVAYTGMQQMPTAEQLQETIDTLRAEGGRMVFLGELAWSEAVTALQAAGFRAVAKDPTSQFAAFQDTRGSAGGP
jgi:hypothetical protein